jgi:hypothetical protein
MVNDTDKTCHGKDAARWLPYGKDGPKLKQMPTAAALLAVVLLVPKLVLAAATIPIAVLWAWLFQFPQLIFFKVYQFLRPSSALCLFILIINLPAIPGILLYLHLFPFSPDAVGGVLFPLMPSWANEFRSSFSLAHDFHA